MEVITDFREVRHDSSATIAGWGVALTTDERPMTLVLLEFGAAAKFATPVIKPC